MFIKVNVWSWENFSISDFYLFLTNLSKNVRKIIHSIGSFMFFMSVNFLNSFFSKIFNKVRANTFSGSKFRPFKLMTTLFVRKIIGCHSTVCRNTPFWNAMFGFEMQHLPQPLFKKIVLIFEYSVDYIFCSLLITSQCLVNWKNWILWLICFFLFWVLFSKSHGFFKKFPLLFFPILCSHACNCSRCQAQSSTHKTKKKEKQERLGENSETSILHKVLRHHIISVKQKSLSGTFFNTLRHMFSEKRDTVVFIDFQFHKHSETPDVPCHK